jgi:N-dimethylarginine dimethylaminohydrolase
VAGTAVVRRPSPRLDEGIVTHVERTAELLAARGYRPVPVEIDEFEKREGCVTCLSIRVRA